MNRRTRNQAILLYLAIVTIVLFRTLPWILWGKETTDSDEALFGLMAKHLAEGREFPIFRWGQSYLLAASSYMAAPLFRLFGTSVALMRLPLLAINLLVGTLMAFLIRRDSRLNLTDTFICCLWFLLPSMLASRELAFADYGAIESLPFLLATWMLREKQLTGGLLCGVGYAIRPYALYGIPALAILDYREKGFKKAFSNWVKWMAGICASYAVILYFGRLSPYYRGNSIPLYMKPVRHMLEDIRGFFAEIMTQTTGLQIHRLNRNITLPIRGHFDALGFFLCGVGAYLLFVLIRTSWRDRHVLWRKLAEKKELQFGFYLTIVGLVNFAAYVVQGPPSDDIRYTYALLFGMVGLYVLLRQLGTDRLIQRLALVLVLGMALNNLYANAVTIGDLRKLDQAHPTDDLIAYLHQHGIRAFIGGEYGYAAYNITLNSGETAIVSSGRLDPHSWYPPYDRFYLNTPPENRAKIQLTSCPGGQHVGYWYVCPAPH